MVGFNLPEDKDIYSELFIYIPLWSDSIENDSLQIQTRLYIYIPLWSDSIYELHLLKLQNRHIYIPLWSDSIGTVVLKSIDANLFTFHYGRIQSGKGKENDR